MGPSSSPKPEERVIKKERGKYHLTKEQKLIIGQIID